MKKWIVPLLLFAAVFFVSWLYQPFTLICQEYEGLFLNAPDYWTRAFGQPWPISGIVSDFLIQFYRDPVYGALITASLLVLAFLLLRGVLRSFRLSLELIPALGAGVLWFLLARASGPKMAVAVVLVLLLVFVGSKILRFAWNDMHDGLVRGWKWDVPAAVLLVLAAGACVVLDPVVQRTERYSRVKRDALYGVWDDLLKTVPPSVAEKDPELLSFALLALSGKEQLDEKIQNYPVYEENDLDMIYYDGVREYAGSLLFKACLYQYLGCYNEAIHNYFQWATQQEKGTSFIVLRRLVELYCLQGNYPLMEKYCRVLERSSANGAYVRHFRAQAAKGLAEGLAQQPTPAAERAAIPVISHDPLYNLLLLGREGFTSPMLEERVGPTLFLRQQDRGSADAPAETAFGRF